MQKLKKPNYEISRGIKHQKRPPDANRATQEQVDLQCSCTGRWGLGEFQLKLIVHSPSHPMENLPIYQVSFLLKSIYHYHSYYCSEGEGGIEGKILNKGKPKTIESRQNNIKSTNYEKEIDSIGTVRFCCNICICYGYATDLVKVEDNNCNRCFISNADEGYTRKCGKCGGFLNGGKPKDVDGWWQATFICNKCGHQSAWKYKQK